MVSLRPTQRIVLSVPPYGVEVEGEGSVCPMALSAARESNHLLIESHAQLVRHVVVHDVEVVNCFGRGRNPGKIRGSGVFLVAGLSPSIPVTSKR